MLTKDQIMKADDFKKEIIDVPEWGGKVCIRVMSAMDRDSLESEMFNDDGSRKDDFSGLRSRVCVRAICDENGERIFADDEYEALGMKSSIAINRIFPKAQALNALSQKEIEEMVGNSPEDPKGGLPSD